eukprot:TRINITY_DN28832_c0_g1_i2.p2 TRINITY_DN28832_c0_g1~~TRINITY_DN28832_c0_g1_i2.p2  ORF type:complete len:253 (-),score=44.06 TRINITY_DN28832_c0_g1_i2:1344-2102(-)
MAKLARLLMVVAAAAAWGPYTHQYFGMGFSRSAEFIAGCSAPDAFKAIAPSLHSFQFAASLYHAAATWNRTQAMEDFALGYGCHLAHDAVGHHANGFLNPSEDHPLELAVDAWVYRHGADRFQPIPTEMTELMAIASAQAHVTWNGTIPVLTVADASRAVSKFGSLVKIERVGLMADWLYERQMGRESWCNVSSFGDVLLNLWRSGNWSEKACGAWQRAMRASVPGTSAIEQLGELVESMFAGNNDTSCTST